MEVFVGETSWAARRAERRLTRRERDFRRLFDDKYTPMVRLARALLGDHAEAEEIVQEAFADVHRRWDHILNPGGYLRTSVVNGARRTMRRRIQRDDLYVLLGATERDNEPDHDYVLDLLDALPDRQRAAIVLAYYADLPGRDIAEILDCRPGTAKSLIHRGLERIRKELER